MLRADHVSKSFEGNPALKDVSFAAETGRVVALCGENGAGKSTMMRILSGAVLPDSGEISLDGKRVALSDPKDSIRLGIRTVYQELSLLPHLTVAENIMLGRMPAAGPRWRIDWHAADESAAAALRELGFPNIDVRARVSDLSVSRQQIVEIAKALVEQPRVLILDEPSSVLSVRETDRLFAHIRELTAAGTIVLYISHRMEEIFEISDDVVVLKDGVVVLTSPACEIDRDQLITAMVGRPLSAIFPDDRRSPGKPVLEVCELSRPGAFEDVSFSVHAREIVGMFGLVGSGRSEVAYSIFGAEPAATGEIRVDGLPVRISSPADAIRCGMVLVTEDRKRDGLLLEAGAVDNGGLASMPRFARAGVLDSARQRGEVFEQLDRLSVKPPRPRGPVRSLSGGNQQKVVLGKWLMLDKVRVFIFDEPTRGVDIGTKVEIYRMIADLAAAGSAVVLISSEMPEVLGLSDRLLVMRDGRIVADLAKDAFSMETVFGHAAEVGLKRSA